jgi:hypothetical protein
VGSGSALIVLCVRAGVVCAAFFLAPTCFRNTYEVVLGHRHLPGSGEVRFRLPADQIEALRTRAADAGVSQAEYLRDLVTAHLDPSAAIDAAMAEAGSETDAILKIRRELHRRLDSDPGSIKDSLFGRLAEWALDEEKLEQPGSDLAQLLAAVGEDPDGVKVEDVADILRVSSLPDDRRLELAELGLVAYQRSRERTVAAEADLSSLISELRAMPV